MTDDSELLAPDRLLRFLDDTGLGTGPLTFRRIGDGQSNLTFLVERQGARLALRRGPRPPFPPSAHDMMREARVLTALADRGIPLPIVRAVCEDPGVLGVPFYVMDFLEGVVVTDEVPPALDDAAGRRELGERLVDTLVAIHDVDARSEPVASLGRPEGYLQRQVDRFGKVYDQIATRELPAVPRLGAWLTANRPESPSTTIVHGDFRMGNLMYAATAPARVVAVLDWEMATVGDPLADLGYLVATYSDAGSAPTPMDLTPVTRRDGFPDRAGLIERYSARSGRDVEGLAWYETLALWKAAVFSEAIYTRWLAGERPDDTTFAPGLAAGVPALLDLALEAARG